MEKINNMKIKIHFRRVSNATIGKLNIVDIIADDGIRDCRLICVNGNGTPALDSVQYFTKSHLIFSHVLCAHFMPGGTI